MAAMAEWPWVVGVGVLPPALLVGLWAGVSGYSGWPIVVPLLFIAGELSIRESIAVSLAVDAVNATAAALVYHRRGRLRAGVARDLGAWVLGPALVGVALAIAFLDRFSDLLRGAAPWVVVLVGVGLMVRSWHTPDVVSAPEPLAAASAHRKGWSRALAAVSGLAMGLVGMGGAFNLALIFMFILGMSTLSSVASGLLITAAVAPVLLIAHLVFLEGGLSVGAALLPALACSALGAVLGARHAGHLPERRLAFSVGACVVMAGLASTGLAEMLTDGGLPG
jgi:uncharacterized membrane protein YfcA